MRLAYFITHPEVVVDAGIPVPQWGLSDSGRARMAAFLQQPFVGNLRSVFSSEEAKAREAADMLAGHCSLQVRRLETLGENDRSATGFLPKDLFEAAADEFFAHPSKAYRGWETAIAAQRRIVNAVDTLLKEAPEGDVAIVSHGAVGTLFKCHLKGIGISRSEDQRSQGNYYTFDAGNGRLLHDWVSISDLGSPNRGAQI